MKSRPIIFSAPMVRALLEGRKTQTRRICKEQPPDNGKKNQIWWPDGKGWDMAMFNVFQSRWRVGDELWVRERVRVNKHLGEYIYRDDVSDDVAAGFAWCPSIHMPREASRLTLVLTDVRVQRVQEIDKWDAFAEGIAKTEPNPVASYRSLWESINGDGSWAENSWVWALTFTVKAKN